MKKKFKMYTITRRLYLAEAIDIDVIVIARSEDEAIDALEAPEQALLMADEKIIEDHNVIDIQVREIQE